MDGIYICLDCGNRFHEDDAIVAVPLGSVSTFLETLCPQCKSDDFVDEDRAHLYIKPCRTNEFGEHIPHMLSVAPVDSCEVTSKILDAMEVLR